jgi:hypothetical protein
MLFCLLVKAPVLFDDLPFLNLIAVDTCQHFSDGAMENLLRQPEVKLPLPVG